MSDFEKWFRSLNANGKTVYFLGNEHKVSEMAWNHQQAIIDEHTEVIKIQDADLRKYEKQIESLKAQLNNMEACYIEKKKQVETVSHMLEGDLKYVEQDGRGNFDFLQMAMIRCLGDAIKALRGGHETK